MQKVCKFLGIFVVCIAMVFVMTACKNDNDNDGDNGDGAETITRAEFDTWEALFMGALSKSFADRGMLGHDVVEVHAINISTGIVTIYVVFETGGDEFVTHMEYTISLEVKADRLEMLYDLMGEIDGKNFMANPMQVEVGTLFAHLVGAEEIFTLKLFFS